MIPGQLLAVIRGDDTGNATASLSGTASEGSILTSAFNNNDPDGPAIGTPTRQWIRGASTVIVGATNTTYTLQAADVGSTVKCRWTYVDGKGHSETIDSPSSATVVFTDTGNATATVTGTAHVGQTLTVTFNNNDPDGAATGITYQWIRGASTVISGATATTYLLTSADTGSTVKCRVSYTDGKGFAEVIDSNSTATVVSPGSSTFDSGSGFFVVPVYNTLTVELWGPGAGGSAGSGGGEPFHPSPPGNTECTTLNMIAFRGSPATGGTATTPDTGGVAIGASGGNSANLTGTNGGNGHNPAGGGAATSGAGGTGGNGGGAGGASVVKALAPTGFVNGNPGTAPGGGGGGAASSNSAVRAKGYAGGSGGGYCRSVFSAGQIAVGANLFWAVSPGGAGTSTGGVNGGAGANGRAKFTWS